MPSEGSDQNQTARSVESREEVYSRCRAHVLARIEEAAVGVYPFYHTFIDGIFPADFYEAVRAHMVSFKHSDGRIAARYTSPMAPDDISFAPAIMIT